LQSLSKRLFIIIIHIYSLEPKLENLQLTKRLKDTKAYNKATENA